MSWAEDFIDVGNSQQMRAVRQLISGREVLAEVVLDGNTYGVWDYASGVAGTVVIPTNRRVLQITAICLEGAGSVTINGGSAIVIPYGTADKVSSAITIVPKGSLVAPTIEFTGTKSYFVEHVL